MLPWELTGSPCALACSSKQEQQPHKRSSWCHSHAQTGTKNNEACSYATSIRYLQAPFLLFKEMQFHAVATQQKNLHASLF